MTEIRFYHLQRSALELALPKLLEKTLERGWRAVVMAGSEERVEALNTVLWNYVAEGFLPHGSKKDGHPERQPVWLTDQDEKPQCSIRLVFARWCQFQKNFGI
ncbi:MAG: DNA polymerase III subunit chi [Candidatus Latescibacterota bacterium]